jgi:hypothetical protein
MWLCESMCAAFSHSGVLLQLWLQKGHMEVVAGPLRFSGEGGSSIPIMSEDRGVEGGGNVGVILSNQAQTRLSSSPSEEMRDGRMSKLFLRYNACSLPSLFPSARSGNPLSFPHASVNLHQKQHPRTYHRPSSTLPRQYKPQHPAHPEAGPFSLLSRSHSWV